MEWNRGSIVELDLVWPNRVLFVCLFVYIFPCVIVELGPYIGWNPLLHCDMTSSIVLMDDCHVSKIFSKLTFFDFGILSNRNAIEDPVWPNMAELQFCLFVCLFFYISFEMQFSSKSCFYARTNLTKICSLHQVYAPY